MGKYDGYDPNKHRASLSYIFGFTDKPYKSRDEPTAKNLKPNPYTTVASDPAKVLEWVASDGRKNSLNSKRNMCALVSEKENSSKAASTTAKKSKSAKSDENKGFDPTICDWNQGSSSSSAKSSRGDSGEENKGGFPWMNDADNTRTTGGGAAGADASKSTTDNANADASKGQDKNEDRFTTQNDTSSKDDKAKNGKDTSKDKVKESDTSKPNEPNPHKFTKEQDEKLLELKNKPNGGTPWKEIAKQIGDTKDEQQCKDRWMEVKPKDWKPAVQEKGQGKEKKKKGEKNNQSGGDKKEDTAKGEVDDGGIFGMFDLLDAMDGNQDTGKKDETKKNEDTSKNTTKSASATGSKHSVTYQTTLTPDKIFSLQDLKLLATIAKEDNARAFNRIADRFWDKTDRRIPPEVFEKKFTGRCAREEKQKAQEKEREERREKEKKKRMAYDEEMRRQKEWDKERAKEQEEEMARRASKAHFGSMR